MQFHTLWPSASLGAPCNEPSTATVPIQSTVRLPSSFIVVCLIHTSWSCMLCVLPFKTCSTQVWLHCESSFPDLSLFASYCLVLVTADVSWQFYPCSFVCHTFAYPVEFTSFFDALLTSVINSPTPSAAAFSVSKQVCAVASTLHRNPVFNSLHSCLAAHSLQHLTFDKIIILFLSSSGHVSESSCF